MKYFIMLLFILTLTSCNDRNDTSSSNDVTNQSVHVTIDKDKTIKELKQEREQLLVQLDSYNTIIKVKELERVTFWSKLVGGVFLGLATICLVASFFLLSYPKFVSTTLRYSSYILAGVGFLAFTVSYIYPYLIPVGFVTLFVILVVTGIAWYRDRQAAVSIAAGVQSLKMEVPHYREIMKKHVNGVNDKWIDKIRESI